VTEDPVDRPPPEVPPPADDASPSTAPKPEAESKTTRVRHHRSWFGDLTKASFVVQVFAAVVAVIGVAAAIAIPLALNSGSTAGSPTTASAGGSTTPSEQPAPKRYVSPNASCEEYVDTAARDGGRRLFVGSPGQLAGGPAVELRLLPSGRYSRVVRAVPGDVFSVSTQLGNVEYGSLSRVSVEASVSADRGRCWRIVMAAREPSDAGTEVEWQPVLILLQHGAPTNLEYIPGSTVLEEESGRAIGGGLPDGVVGNWIQLPYEIPGGTIYYLNFEVRIGRSQSHLGRTS
jgi:hypothetical protein